MPYCDVCDIRCPSDYQMNEHLNSWKHTSKNSPKESNLYYPKCDCRKESARRTVMKDGPNRGRPFFTCEGMSCKFFQWADLDFNVSRSSSSETKDSYVILRTTDEIKKKSFQDELSIEKDSSLADLPIQFELLSKNDIQMKFPYSDKLISLIKKHIKGRSWNSTSKAWIIPSTSAIHLVALCESIGIHVPHKIQKLVDDIEEKSATHFGKPIDPTFKITLVKANKQSMDVHFAYDVAIVACIKTIHPQRRSFDPTQRKWAINLKALPDFVDALMEEFPSSLVIPKELKNLIKKIEEEMDNEEDKSFEIDLTGDSDDEIEWSFMKKQRLEISITSTIKTKLDSCECGNPGKRVDGIHICRFYGTFECPQCYNRWTSAYTWKGEKQACRVCEMESLPIKRDKLERRLPTSAINGHHDTSRCGMCRKLGRDCSM